MTASLDGPLAKLARAREHVQTLKPELAAFYGGKPYRAVYECDPNSGEHIWRLKIDHMPPVRLSVVVGDVVHNFRSALDHLIWQLSLLTTPNPYKRSEFPVYDFKVHPAEPKRNDCFDNDGKRKIQHVPIEAQKLIESAQPYQRGNPYGVFLALLHEIDIADKHRITIVPCPAVTGFRISHMVIDGALSTPLAIGPVMTNGNDGDVLLRLPAAAVFNPEDQEKVQFAFEVGVLTSQSSKGRNYPLIDLINGFDLLVGHELLPQCERFFVTLGPGFSGRHG